MAERLKRVKGYFAYITCYIKRAKPRFFKGLRQLKEEVRLILRALAQVRQLGGKFDFFSAVVFCKSLICRGGFVAGRFLAM
jgi:hypothetical protein